MEGDPKKSDVFCIIIKHRMGTSKFYTTADDIGVTHQNGNIELNDQVIQSGTQAKKEIQAPMLHLNTTDDGMPALELVSALDVKTTKNIRSV